MKTVTQETKQTSEQPTSEVGDTKMSLEQKMNEFIQTHNKLVLAVALLSEKVFKLEEELFKKEESEKE